jgi:hypothetical protein
MALSLKNITAAAKPVGNIVEILPTNTLGVQLSESETTESRKTAIVTPPDPMSEGCHKFFFEHWELATHYIYICVLTTDKDEYEKQIAKIRLDNGLFTEKEKPLLEVVSRIGVGAWKALMHRQQFLLQTMLCRAVDNYLSYISDLLTIVFKSKPETLRSNEQVKCEDILQYTTIEEIIGFLAEQKVHDLSYKGMRSLAEYVKNRLGFMLCEQGAVFDRIVFLIELRNLISHNRCIVNRIFKARLPTFAGSIGDLVVLDMMQTFGDMDLLATSVCDIEGRAAAKWAFPRPQARNEHDDRIQGLQNVLDRFEAALKGIAARDGITVPEESPPSEEHT